MAAVAFGGILERPAHDPVSVRSVGSVRRRAVVGFAEHEDTRAGVGVAVPHVGEEMDGLSFLQMLPEHVRSCGHGTPPAVCAALKSAAFSYPYTPGFGEDND